MKSISEIDKNFKIETKLNKDDIVFYDVKKEPFKIYGIFHEDGKFRRLPEEVAKTVSEGVHYLSANTAGGRVRFKTDSQYVAINAKMGVIGKMPHFALTGSAGFDLYYKMGDKDVYYKTFMPPNDVADEFESIVEFDDKAEREITIDFPLYSEVCELYIGLQERAAAGKAAEYKIKKPIVYYGSSITQGGCASRGGNSYQAIISRRLDCDHINLGFSGNAKGECEIAEYIKNLDMTAFVYDYDYNAPTAKHLEETHERMFKTIREAHPYIPIIMLTRPKIYLSDLEEENERAEIVKKTYTNAVEAGDKNVYFILGSELMSFTENDGTVDGCHPNDLGFSSMAKVLGDCLEKILKL